MLRVAILGAGVMGRHHGRVFALCESVRVAGIVDVDASAASTLASQLGAEPMRMERAFASCAAVVIATPMESHATLAGLALGAGLHVLVEKPICTTASQARQLGEVARRAGLVLATGHSERFNGAVRALVSATRHDPIVGLRTTRSMPQPRAARGSMMLNLAVHDLDLARHLSRSAIDLAHAHGDGDRATLLTSIGDRAFGEHALSQRANDRTRTMVGSLRSGARFEADLLANRLTIDGRPVETPREEPLLAQARAFVAAVTTGDMSSLATAEDAAAAVALALEADARCSRSVSSTPAL